MTIINTAPPRGLFAWLGRICERINVGVSLHYAESDLAYERELLDALPAKVQMLEQHAAHLRVRQSILRDN